MRSATLTRGPSTEDGTFGKLVTDSGFECETGELPWRNNAPGISCIPSGTYMCERYYSPKHGNCYHVVDVPDRTDVEIHSANFVGDREKGLRCELLGCIAVGEGVGALDGQLALLDSKAALAALERDMGGEDFELTIVDQIG